jgi:hypothetical protein
MSILDRLHTNAADVGVFATIALIFGLIKWAVTPGPVHWKTTAINLIIGVSVGVITGGLALELNAGDFGAITATSVASLLSRELVDFIRDKQALGALAKQAAENLIDKATK